MTKKKKILIVGSGFYGSIFANTLTEQGFLVKVIDKRDHIGGNCYTENSNNIHIHKYGPHIFHTNDRDVWDWINKYCEMENYIFSPVANYNGELYTLPFNLWTFYQLWGESDIEVIKQRISQQSQSIKNPKNLEEQAISLVGKDVYDKLIYGYTKKQWGVDPKNLPNFIIKRLPVRLTFNTNYFNDHFQGIPKNGYTEIFDNLLRNIDVQLNVDYFNNREYFEKEYDHIVYSGPIDRFYNYQFGHLDYRSLRWETKKIESENFQGNSVVNFTSEKVPYTRIIEHKHFNRRKVKDFTVISKEYPLAYNNKNEPFYPINNDLNNSIYLKYSKLANNDSKFTIGGRLGRYKYFDMHQVIAMAIKESNELCDKLKY